MTTLKSQSQRQTSTADAWRHDLHPDAPPGEDRFRTMADGLPLMIWVHDADGRQQFVNRTFCEFFGITAEQAEGEGWQALVHPDDAAAYAGEFLACTRERRFFRGECRVVGGDGGWRHIESWGRPRFGADGEFLGMVGTSADITERKASERHLLDQAARLAFLSESAGILLASTHPTAFLDHIFARLAPLLDLDAYLHYSMDRAEDCLVLAASGGLTDEQRQALARLVPGQAICGLVAAECRPIVVRDVQASAEERTSHIRAIGISCYACHPLVARDGTVIGTLSFGSRRRDAFDKVEVQLMAAVCDQVATAIEREGTAKALVEADRNKDEFLATLAHELRNPLAALSSGLALTERIPAGDPRQENVRKMMSRQLTHLVRLIDDLTDVSRISRGQIQLRRRRVVIEDAVASAIEACHAKLDAKNQSLTVANEAPGIAVQGDADRLAQVCANLLTNAVKYTPDGGTISIRMEQDGNDAVVTVRDSGAGIPARYLDRVFEMFTQLRPHEDPVQGLGIGLALVRQIVELHGGSVRAFSEGPGLGSQFVVRLPLDA